MATTFGSIIPESTLYSSAAGEILKDALSERRSLSSGALTLPPRRKLLMSAFAENESKEPSFERNLRWEEPIFPSSEVNPPVWNSAEDIISAG